ncbi:hypothetical protein P171DRAFT_440748 [Karstenula rhodostoma CBS 690.94]|uniref:Uncharacterized protein n=1 Tax=Karstenula rhodostoma CBS 690.94 TaxID=1392251 RepID=A0A9P4UGB8_9PLEO|nr:hypothetical protein P171DRAFT_440748 [Karstenula rhodostoma CBS 690.94]
MGSASSHPQQPPLIALNGGSFGKHNTILVPAEAFAGKWGPKRKFKGRPNYRPVYPDPFAYLPPPRVGRGRGRKGWGVGVDDTLSEGDMRPRNRGVGRRRGGLAMPMPMPYYPGMPAFAPPGAVPVMYDLRGARARSAPNLQAGYIPAVRGGRAKNMGMGNFPGAGFQPGMVPGYGPVAGMPAPAYAAAAAPSPAPQPRMPARAPPQQQKMRHPPGVEAVAKGVHYAQPAAQLPRRKSEPLVSAQLNRSQPPNKRAGPSGQEWLPSENAFLDACTCTTNCNCRKGARVLYRHQGQGQGDGEQNTWGEIRYVLKDDLGRDCGDHSRCREKEEEESDGGRKKGKKGKGKNGERESGDVEKMREEMKGLREDIKNMTIGVGRMGMGAAAGQIPTNMGRMPSQGGWPGMMDGRMDPRMAQRMGSGDAYGMEFMPQMQQPMRGGRSGRMPGRVADMDLEDDVSFEDAEEIMDSRMGPRMMKMPPHPRNPGPRRPRQHRGPPRRPPRRVSEFDPHREYAPRPGRRGNVNGPGQRGGGRPPPPPPEYDLDDDSMGSGMDGRGRFGPMDDDEGNWPPTGGRHGKTPSEWNPTQVNKYTTGMDNDFNMAPPPPPGQSPRGGGRGRGSGSGEGRAMGAEGRRPNQAHVDDGDDY